MYINKDKKRPYETFESGQRSNDPPAANIVPVIKKRKTNDIDPKSERQKSLSKVKNAGSDGKEMGKVGRAPNGTLLWKDSRQRMIPAVYHDSIRHELLNTASNHGALRYTYPRKKGLGAFDETAYHPDQRDWSFERPLWHTIRHDILNRLEETDHHYEYKDVEHSNWYHHDGRIIIDHDNHPVRVFPDLPATLSSAVTGPEIEAWCRLDNRIKRSDIRARLPRYRQLDADGHLLEPIYTLAAIGNKRNRFRLEEGLIAWEARVDNKAVRQFMKSRLNAEDLARNTTKNTTALNHDERNVLARIKGKAGSKSKEKKEIESQETRQTTSSVGAFGGYPSMQSPLWNNQTHQTTPKANASFDTSQHHSDPYAAHNFLASASNSIPNLFPAGSGPIRGLPIPHLDATDMASENPVHEDFIVTNNDAWNGRNTFQYPPAKLGEDDDYSGRGWTQNHLLNQNPPPFYHDDISEWRNEHHTNSANVFDATIPSIRSDATSILQNLNTPYDEEPQVQPPLRSTNAASDEQSTLQSLHRLPLSVPQSTTHASPQTVDYPPENETAWQSLGHFEQQDLTEDPLTFWNDSYENGHLYNDTDQLNFQPELEDFYSNLEPQQTFDLNSYGNIAIPEISQQQHRPPASQTEAHHIVGRDQLPAPPLPSTHVEQQTNSELGQVPKLPQTNPLGPSLDAQIDFERDLPQYQQLSASVAQSEIIDFTEMVAGLPQAPCNYQSRGPTAVFSKEREQVDVNEQRPSKPASLKRRRDDFDEADEPPPKMSRRKQKQRGHHPSVLASQQARSPVIVNPKVRRTVRPKNPHHGPPRPRQTRQASTEHRSLQNAANDQVSEPQPSNQSVQGLGAGFMPSNNPTQNARLPSPNRNVNGTPHGQGHIPQAPQAIPTSTIPVISLLEEDEDVKRAKELQLFDQDLTAHLTAYLADPDPDPDY